MVLFGNTCGPSLNCLLIIRLYGRLLFSRRIDFTGVFSLIGSFLQFAYCRPAIRPKNKKVTSYGL